MESSTRRLAVAFRRRIAAPADAVWRAISTPGHLAQCHPFCESNPVARWPGVGSRDTIRYHGGRVLHRRFTGWIEGTGYDLLIGGDDGRTSRVTWRIRAVASGDSTLGITIEPHLLDLVPPAFRRILHALYVGPMLRRYLRSVVKGVEWNVLTGTPVTRNQFGAHRWFSPRRAR